MWNIALTLTRSRTLTHTLTLTRYAHVWNIVAQPDGTFHWLQSFINHYSLPSWLRQSDARSERHLPLESNPSPNPNTNSSTNPNANLNPNPNPNPNPKPGTCRSRRCCTSSISSAS